MKRKSILWIMSLFMAALLGSFIGSSIQKMTDQGVSAQPEGNIIANRPDLLQQTNINNSSMITQTEREAVPLNDLLRNKTIKDMFEVVRIHRYSLSPQDTLLQPACPDDSLLVGGGYWAGSDKVIDVDSPTSTTDIFNPEPNSWTVLYHPAPVPQYSTVTAQALCLKLK